MNMFCFGNRRHLVADLRLCSSFLQPVSLILNLSSTVFVAGWWKSSKKLKQVSLCLKQVQWRDLLPCPMLMVALERGPKKNGMHPESHQLPDRISCIHWGSNIWSRPLLMLFSSSYRSSSSRGISFEIPLDGDPTLSPCEAPPLRGMTRSASSDGLGFKVHFASRGGIKRHVSLMPVNVNGRHIPEEEEDFTPHKPLGRNNTFSIKNHNR